MSCGPSASFSDKGQDEACFLIDALASYSITMIANLVRYYMEMSHGTLSLYLPSILSGRLETEYLWTVSFTCQCGCGLFKGLRNELPPSKSKTYDSKLSLTTCFVSSLALR